MSFPALKRLLNTHIRILVAVFTNAFLITNSSYSKFIWLMKETKKNDGIVLLCEDYDRNNDLLRLYK